MLRRIRGLTWINPGADASQLDLTDGQPEDRSLIIG
jgi:hypothetical protein